jgi:uncharacterized protein YbjT (DUF2867 family)
MSGQLRVLLFGATGTAGGSVLEACLAAPEVGEVRSLSRRAPKRTHPRLRAVVHGDFLDYTAVARDFEGVDLCLFCLGKSVSQVSGEAEYRVITHDYAVAAARCLRERSPRTVFHYLSGAGASLTSKSMWARVKAETEVDMIREFGSPCWRPASIDGADSDNAPRIYQLIRPVSRLFRGVRSLYIQGEDIGYAMLQAHREGIAGRVIENPEMRDLADRYQAAVKR